MDASMQPDTAIVYTAIALTAVTVFALRLAGFLGGRMVNLDGRARRIVNALPGCALAAIVAPAAMRGTPVDVAIVVGIFAMFLWTGRTVLCLMLGVGLCVLSGHYAAGTFAGFF